MCDYTNLPAPQCLERSCEKCGSYKIKGFLETDIVSERSQLNTTNIKWFKWESIQVMDENHNKVKRVTSCVPKITSVEDFLSELSSDLEKYPSHMFRANWQHKELQNCVEQLKDGQVVMLMDFSENYRCRFQNESQSAYFDQQQVTAHPFMCYYMNSSDQTPAEETGIERHMVKHSVIVVSDDKRHDAFAVKQFEKETMAVLQEQTKVNQIIKFSDGCAAQYKGKNYFGHLSKSEIPVCANYFETSHGKSPCDGLGAVLKNACFNTVKSQEAVIGNARDAYDFCKNKLEHNKVVKKGDQVYISRRNIVYVDKSDVQREEMGVKTLTGTRSVHAVKSTNTPFSVQARNLSCFCSGCVENSGHCDNSDYVQPWTTHNLCPGEQKRSNQSTSTPSCVADPEPDQSTNTVDAPARADTNRSPVRSCTVQQSDHSSMVVADMQPVDPVEPVVGGFVLVSLTDNRRGHDIEKEFVARVLEVDGSECKLTYMAEKIVKNKKFLYWPEDDVSWEDNNKIVKILPEPELSVKSTSRNLLFTI